jgi:hypothetical protein
MNHQQRRMNKACRIPPRPFFPNKLPYCSRSKYPGRDTVAYVQEGHKLRMCRQQRRMKKPVFRRSLPVFAHSPFSSANTMPGNVCCLLLLLMHVVVRIIFSGSQHFKTLLPQFVFFSPGGKTKVKLVRLGALSSLKGKEGKVVCKQKLLLLCRYPSDTITAVIRRRPHCLDLAKWDENEIGIGGDSSGRNVAQFGEKLHPFLVTLSFHHPPFTYSKFRKHFFLLFVRGKRSSILRISAVAVASSLTRQLYMCYVEENRQIVLLLLLLHLLAPNCTFPLSSLHCYTN